MALLLRVSLTVTLLLAAVVGIAESEDERRTSIFKDHSYRLPDKVAPTNYKINITVTFEEGRFTGSVEITAIVNEDTPQIVMHYDHAKSTDLVSKVLQVQDNGTEVELNVASNDTYNFLILSQENEEPFPKGNIKLRIEYDSHLAQDMTGLYFSTYEDKEGKTQYLASTQFEPTYARKAFPCFDEPHMKATFDLIIVAPKGYDTVISNTKMKTVINKSDKKEFIFETTPKMSTYLLAFVISNSLVQNDLNSTIPLSVYYQSAFEGQESEALSTGKLLLEHLENNIGIDFEIQKLDQVAIPDLAGEATENWGLITYREQALMFDQNASSTISLQNVVTLLAKAYTQLWFGDLVGPSWWKFLWINKGFATYFGYHAVAAVDQFKNWRLAEQFVVDTVQMALNSDAIGSTHPMTTDVWTPDEILYIFDEISHEKSGSVIRMMEQALGSEVFTNGIRSYLNNKKESVATESDLFDALQEALGSETKLQVKEIFVNWTQQAGYPVLNININGSKVSVQQERFFIRKIVSKDDSLWVVPLTYQTSDKLDHGGTSISFWLKDKEDLFNLEEDIGDNFLLANIMVTGFYRVNYDLDNWKKIFAELKSNYSNIYPVNRAQLLDDAFNLALAGYMDYDSMFNLTLYLEEETDFIPWNAAFKAFSYLNDRLRDDKEAIAEFRKYVRKILEKAYNENKFEIEKFDHVDKLHQMQILSWACEVQNDDCLNTAANLLKVKNYSEIKANLKNIVYCYGLKSQNREQAIESWNRLLDYYTNTTIPTEKQVVLSSLGCIDDTVILHRFLNEIVNGTEIRLQDIASIFSSVADNVNGFNLALDFFTEKYVQQSYKWMASLHKIINSILSKVNNKEQLDKVKDWANRNMSLGSAQWELEQAMEKAEMQIEWVDNHKKFVVQWLKSYNFACTNTASLMFWVLIAFNILKNLI